ncbi:hypothetical protein KP77_22580 [Jeotgalibacillus alimentarius]|uniref:Novel toxin 21 domain-containing protein n=1 Tax=Jeotgalibacillus alimentarius TaxID=135826 RepID=A0A0C2VW26_9BACL|nr:hypothetical protein [Jeotgalibacillus alimentarius]KIL48606.1 hypothetical protein KP77_22580 [Jeotgalibacillus alimentarius]
MLRFSKIISGVLVFVLVFAFATSPLVSAETYPQKTLNEFSLEDFERFEDIPEELLDPNFYNEDEIIEIPEEYLNPYHPETIDVMYINSGSANGEFQTFAIAAAAGVYFIPGIGQIALTATGALIIGGATIAAGSWLYNQVSAYFGKKAAEKAADTIPKNLKSSDMKVDLGKFKDKNGNTPKTKTSGTFTNGKWVITKDTAGHTGYNGSKKAWKIGNPSRKASLDRSGNIVGK